MSWRGIIRIVYTLEDVRVNTAGFAAASAGPPRPPLVAVQAATAARDTVGVRIAARDSHGFDGDNEGEPLDLGQVAKPRTIRRG